MTALLLMVGLFTVAAPASRAAARATAGARMAATPVATQVQAAKKKPKKKPKKVCKTVKVKVGKKTKKKKVCTPNGTTGAPAVVATPGGTYTISPGSAILGKMAKWTTVNPYTRHYYLIRSYMQMFESAGGGTLILGSGVYELSSTVYVPSNTTIVLSDGTTLRKINQTGTRKFGPASSMFMLIRPSKGKVKGAVGGHEGDANITFAGAGIGRSVMDLADVKDSLAIIAGHNRNVTISGISFRNMNNNHFIEMDACASCIIRDNEFRSANAGTRFTAEAINLDTPDPKTGGFGAPWSNHDSTPNEDVLVENNQFANLERSVGTHNFSSGKYHTNMVVRGNTITNMRDTSQQPGAMVIMNWRNAVITGNRFVDSRVGINACGTHNPTIQGNTFADIRSSTIRFRTCRSDDGNGSTATSEVSAVNVAAMKDNVVEAGVSEPWAEGLGLSGTVYFNGHEPPPPPPPTVPDAPSYVTIDTYGGWTDTARLSWGTPGNNRSEITGFRIYVYIDAAGTVPAAGTNPIDVRPYANSYDLSQLPTYGTYWFRVSAVNGVGEGSASALTTTSYTKADRPDAPTGVSASAYDHGQSVVSWVAAAPNGADITWYRVLVYTDATGAGPATSYEVDGSATSTRITGLVPSRSYYFRVRAENAKGIGDLSAIVGPVAAAAPGAPTDPQYVPGTSALTWVTPASDGGDAISGYRVSVYDESGVGLVRLATDPGTNLPYPNPQPIEPGAALAGLSGSTVYQLSVQAGNAVGWGAESVKFVAAPAPADLLASPTAGGARLSWTKPTPGTPTGYLVYVFTDAAGTIRAPLATNPLPAPGATLVVTGLTPGTKYYFGVTAKYSSTGGNSALGPRSALSGAVTPTS